MLINLINFQLIHSFFNIVAKLNRAPSIVKSNHESLHT